MHVVTWLLAITTGLLPIIIAPFTNNLVVDSKLYLLIVAALLTLLVFLFRSFQNKGWQLILSPVTPALAFFTGTALISSLVSSNYPVENLLSLGGLYLAAGLIGLIGPSLIRKNSAQLFIKTLVISASVLSLSTLLELVGFGPSRLVKLITNLPIADETMLNLSGSAFLSIQVIALALIGQVANIIKQKKLTTFHVATIPLLIFGLGLNIWITFIAKKTPITFQPISSSWSVALDSLRLPKSALVGQGPAGYINAFQKYKPAWLNSDRYWQTGFNAALNMPFTILVQLGLLGLAAWLMLATNFYLKAKKQHLFKHPLTLMLAFTFALQLLTPPNYVMLGLQGLLIAFWAAHFKDQFPQLELNPLNIDVKLTQADQGTSQAGQTTQAAQAGLTDQVEQSHHTEPVKPETSQAGQAGRGLNLVINGLLTIGVLALFYFAGRTYAAGYHMLEAQKALAQNQGVQVYNHQRLAVALNPYLDAHRRSYARTNMQIATALSNKADGTEQDQQQVSQLIQQAVREARAATTIDPADVRNWSTLANIYQELVGSVEGADQWTVNAYVEAIQTSPSNPLLRIQLGNLLLQQKKVDQAANLLSQAVNLKPDLAAGYYHLGNAQQQNQKLLQAKQSWQQALQLLPADSEDYQTLKQQMEQLQQVINQATQSGQLAAPGQGTPGQQKVMPGTAGMMGQQNQGATDTVMPSEPDSTTPTGEQTLETKDSQKEPQEETAEGDLNKTTPLGQELPSLTDQNLESNENAVSQPQSEPLELDEETEQALSESEAEAEAESGVE